MDKEQAAVLRVIEGLWETHEWVPVDKIESKLPWTRLVLKNKIREMEKQKLISWDISKMGRPAVKMTETGKDILAVWELRNKGVIDDIGHVIGEGKEAVVVLAQKDGRERVIKFHRYYSAEFQRISRSMAFTALKLFRKRIGKTSRPIDIARAKARIEFNALKTLWPRVRVPEPLAINRHAVVMEMIGKGTAAPLLADIRPDKQMKEMVLEQYELAVSLGIVHGELSQFNILVSDGPVIIDWPQSVPADYRQSESIRLADIKRIENYFMSSSVS